MPCGRQSGEVPTLAIAKLLSTTSWDRVDIVGQPSLSAVELPDNMSLSGRLHCLIHHLVVLLHQKLRIVDHLAKAIWVKPSQCHWSSIHLNSECGVK